jgi:acetyl esterase/lipase
MFCLNVNAQKVIPLYTGNIPNQLPCLVKESIPKTGEVDSVTIPTLTIFRPEKQNVNKAAVIIMPGGGYDHLAMEAEGYEVARAFNKIGIVAFVLKYRLPALNNCFINKQFVPLQDAQRAIAVIRTGAKKWNINPNNIGLMGFSAGGHLAATLLTRYDKSIIEDKNTNLRPDWAVLAYPVISMADSLGKTGSKKSLIGLDADEETKKYFSANQQVKQNTPPCFIFQAQNDNVVSVKHSVLFFEALNANRVNAEIHILQKGGHGFGLHNKETKEDWFSAMTNWLLANNWL